MTMEKEKKRMLFWRRSHSQNHMDYSATGVTDAASTSATDLSFQPDNGHEFEEKDVNMGALFMPFIRNYVSNLTHNKSPTKLPYPPNFYYPASSLQHQMMLQMQHVDLLVSANSFPTPQERFIAVLKYTLSTCSVTKFPYKPIIAFLGETDQSFTTHTNNGAVTDTTYYVAEQVERDPAGCAYYIANPTRGVVHEGNVALIPKFKQAHVHVSFVGQRKTILTHPQGLWKEEYVGDAPDLYIRLLRMHTELGGSLNLNCADTGFSATIQFKEKPIFGGFKNAVTGRVMFQGRDIYYIEGMWDSVTYLVDCITKERFELFNHATTQKMKVETYPLDQQPETSGEREWGPLIESLHRRDFEQSKLIKAQLDIDHHERLARFEANGGFVPTMFHRTPEGWEINDPDLMFNDQIQTNDVNITRGIATM